VVIMVKWGADDGYNVAVIMRKVALQSKKLERIEEVHRKELEKLNKLLDMLKPDAEGQVN